MNSSLRHGFRLSALVGLAPALVLLTACQKKVSWSTYYYETGHYRIDHPSDWRPSELPGIRMVMGPHLQLTRLRPMAFLTIQHVVGGGSDLEKVVEGVLAKTPTPLVPYTVESHRDARVGPLPAKVLVVRTEALKGVKGDRPTRSLLAFVRAKHVIWRLDCSVDTDRFVKDRPTCERMIQSFRLDDG